MTAAPGVRVLIVEDEPMARRRLRRLLSHEPDVEVVGEAADADAALTAIERGRPTLLLLDIRLHGGDGFEILRRLETTGVDPAPVVVFVTAYDEHALRAFDVHALDYVLKPIDPDRLHTALERARRRLAETATTARHQRLLDWLRAAADAADLPAPSGERPAEGRPTPSYRQRFAVKRDGRVAYVPTGEVDWIEGAGNYARLHTATGPHLVRETMATLERELDPASFVRVHRSAIVNIARIKELQPWFSGDWVILLQNGAKVKLSRMYRDAFTARLERR